MLLIKLFALIIVWILTPPQKKKKKTVSGLENGVNDFRLLWSGVGNIYQPCFVVVILKVTNC